MPSLLTSSVSEKEACARPGRFYQAAECTTQVELVLFLGVRQSSIFGAKKRKAIPADWLLTLLCKKYINPHWILTGEGPTHLYPYDEGKRVAAPVGGGSARGSAVSRLGQSAQRLTDSLGGTAVR